MNSKVPLYAITLEQSTCVDYRRSLSEELRIGELSETELKLRRIENPVICEYRARLLANRKTYSNYVDWLSFLQERYGSRQRCLSLGSGSGRAERFLVETGFAAEFETIDLCLVNQNPVALNNSRISSRSGDLNFLELEPDRYDFILCHGVLHHLINLEFVMFQLNKALTKDGILLIYEYVGENRWQFTETRMKFLKQHLPNIRICVPKRSTIVGFESIRSYELLPLIKRVFGGATEISVSFGGVYFPYLTGSNGLQDNLLSEVVRLDEDVSESLALDPCYHMGVYRKSSVQPFAAIPWTNEELHRRLDRGLSPFRNTIDAFKYSEAGKMLRKAKRAILSRGRLTV